MGTNKSECSLVPGRTGGMIAGGLIVRGPLLDAGLPVGAEDGEKLLFGPLDGGGGPVPPCP